MLTDSVLVKDYRTRTCRNHGVDILLDAWCGTSTDQRAAMLLAEGDIRASAHGGGWRQLAEGDVVGALRCARSGGGNAMRLLEAEALIATGAIVAGLQQLAALHAGGDPAATVALARRRQLLGNCAGAEQAAAALPLHAQAALIGARAALTRNRLRQALRFLEPFLSGAAPLPEPMLAGAMAVIAASILARQRQVDQLRSFAESLLMAPGLSEDMAPTIARVAWIGGLAGRAWNRFAADSPWLTAARAELALLAGQSRLATRLMQQAGKYASPSTPALSLLQGELATTATTEGDQRMFDAGVAVHIWRTHPHRWRPWIDAAVRTDANVPVFDLTAGILPDVQSIPDVVLDDGSLAELLPPSPVPMRHWAGKGVWFGEPLCRGIGIGHDWPDHETAIVRQATRQATSADDAAVLICSAEAAFERLGRGLRTVVIAPPGDPFWAGPLPERAWQSLRIVRSHPRDGWTGAGARLVAALEELA